MKLDSQLERLIFDRVPNDITARNKKGYYNYNDLNRIEIWCRYLEHWINENHYYLKIDTKIDWCRNDFPTVSELERIRNNIQVLKDENGVEELGFKTKEIARKFVKATSRLSVIYREDRTRYSMQFIADILKKLNEENKISKADLYKLKESEVIDIIEKSKYRKLHKNEQKHTSL